VVLVVVGEPLRDCACEEEDDDDGGRDPEGAVKVCVAFEDVEKVAAGVDGGDAAAENFVGIDVKVLLVVVDGPPGMLGGRAAWGPVAARGGACSVAA
jgi:hypothetical protein